MNSYIKTIGDIAEVFDGPHATPKKTLTGPYFLSISSLENGYLDLTKSAHLNEEDFKKWTKRVMPKKGDILFSYETRLGEVALMPDDIKACLGRRMGLLRPNPKLVLSEYLLYAYLSPSFQQVIKTNTITGATVNRIALTELPNFEVRIPPMEEQRKVSELLSNLDKKMKLNNQVNSKLEAMAKTLYDYWFVQFDFPDVDGKPYKSSGGKMVYNETLKREIPEGWDVRPVSEIIEVRDGTHDSPKPSGKGEYLITSKHLQPSGIDFSNAYFISYEDFEAVNKRSKVDEGDFLISMIGTIGLSQWVMKITTPFAIKNIGLFKTSQSPEYADYIFASVTSSYGKAYLQQNQSTGTSQPYVTLGTLRGIPITIPSKKVFDDFNKKVKPIHKLLYENATENQKLVELRDWLLPMLMNGQVTVGQ